MGTLFQDLRYGLRMLGKNPGFTAVAVLTLALGIGANTAIFSVVNAVLLRPLPFPDADRLVSIRLEHPQRNLHNAYVSYPEVVDWREQSRSFESIAAYAPASVNLSTREEAESASLWKVNANLFPMLGVKMWLGRGFLPEEDRPGGGRVAILSYNLWQRRFGSDASLIGKEVVLDGDSHTVVGILPPGFYANDEPADLYTPIALSGTREGGESRNYAVFARLKRGVPSQQAQTELCTIIRRQEQQYPVHIPGFAARVWGMHAYMVRNVRLSLIVLVAAVALVLLIACANVANLLLARASARQKEIAIRAALGAGRGRVLRQLLTESVLLALLGGIFGGLLAYWGVMALTALGAGQYPMLKQSHLDLTALALTMLLSLGTGLVFGIAPALAASRTNVRGTLQEGGGSSTGSGGRNRLRGLLVVSEVAVALLLMIGASLMMRSFLRLQDVNPGFNPAAVLTASIDLPGTKYPRPEQQMAFYQQLEERLQALPGVTAVGVSSVLPLSGSNHGIPMLIEGRPVRGPADAPILWIRIVNTGYFPAMQIPLRKGRLFAAQDAQGEPQVVMVNETLARRYWPNQDPIGKRVGNGAPNGWMPVVGVVGDIRHMSLAQEPEPEIYLPYAQNPQPNMKLAVRTASDPLRMAPAMRHAVMELDHDQAVSHVASMEQVMFDSVTSERFSTLLLGVFAAVALGLATIGIYGLISFSVTCRKHEIGLRMALGARRADVLRMVVGEGTMLAVWGVAIGLAAAFALTRVISSLLYGVKPTDPLVFVGVPLLLAVVAALASFVPACRAVKVDPMVALRSE